jgi:hypothetical protein
MTTPYISAGAINLYRSITPFYFRDRLGVKMPLPCLKPVFFSRKKAIQPYFLSFQGYCSGFFAFFLKFLA